MKEDKILPDEIELSEVILKKTNHAFGMIQQKEISDMDKQNKRSRRMFKTPAAVIAVVCLLTVSSLSVAAAVRHYWGRGMKGNLQASDVQQQQLTDNGMAVIYSEKEDYESLKVTQNGISIVPDTVIVDERFAYLSFTISGYSVEQGEEPGFEEVDVTSNEVALDMYGGMYDGIIADETGTPVYEDGSAIQYLEDGSEICRYFDENGNLEYNITVHVADEKTSILGRTIDVSFENMGTLYKTSYENSMDGLWKFEIKLPSVSSAQNFELNKEIAGTDFTINRIEISPISLMAYFETTGAPDIVEDEQGIPIVKGVVLRDGTRLPYLTDGGSVGYTDETRKEAYNLFGYDRVIDVDQVQALLIMSMNGSELVTIDLE